MTVRNPVEFVDENGQRVGNQVVLGANPGVAVGNVTLNANPGVDIGDVTLNANAGVDIGDVGVKSYTTVRSGELQGTVVALQMPNIACKMVKFKARWDNAGYVYIGGAGVTVPDGTTDATTGLELDAGEDTGWFPTDNLNRFYRICNNAGDDLTYIALV